MPLVSVKKPTSRFYELTSIFSQLPLMYTKVPCTNERSQLELKYSIEIHRRSIRKSDAGRIIRKNRNELERSRIRHSLNTAPLLAFVYIKYWNKPLRGTHIPLAFRDTHSLPDTATQRKKPIYRIPIYRRLILEFCALISRTSILKLNRIHCTPISDWLQSWHLRLSGSSLPTPESLIILNRRTSNPGKNTPSLFRACRPAKRKPT